MESVNTILIIVFFAVLVVYLLPYYPEPVVYANYISDEEIEYLKEFFEKNNNGQSVIQQDGGPATDNLVRVSETAWLDTVGDKVARSLADRCLKLIDRPIQNCEALQIVKYKRGGFFKVHQDAITVPYVENQRMYTFMFCLNDDFKGGQTTFPVLNKTYKLKKGDMLFFNCLDNYGMLTEKSLHGGLTVRSNEKWIANLWVRTYPFEYSLKD